METKRDIATLYLVVPCYNEAEVIHDTAGKLQAKFADLRKKNLIKEDSRIIFVNDGSKDTTWKIICGLHEKNHLFSGLCLAHNRGHQNALYAGLMFAKDKADVVISIDADLQQDIQAMDLFLAEYYKGCDIVYGVRNSRDTDSFFKKMSAKMFYSMMRSYDDEVYTNSADYRLMSKKALEALSEYSEVNLFLRGIIPDIGLKSGVVHFDVFPRIAGESKYTLKKMMKLALDGITSFTIQPLHYILTTGILFVLISIIMMIITVVEYFQGKNVPGYSTMMCSMWFIGGVIVLSLGVVGEYVGRSYEEGKKRPRYFVEDIRHE